VALVQADGWLVSGVGLYVHPGSTSLAGPGDELLDQPDADSLAAYWLGYEHAD
jgi:hypothetical protein